MAPDPPWCRTQLTVTWSCLALDLLHGIDHVAAPFDGGELGGGGRPPGRAQRAAKDHGACARSGAFQNLPACEIEHVGLPFFFFVLDVGFTLWPNALGPAFDRRDDAFTTTFRLVDTSVYTQLPNVTSFAADISHPFRRRAPLNLATPQNLTRNF